MRRFTLLFFILSLLVVLISPQPAFAHSSAESRVDGSIVARALGTHSYILGGERWVYQDSVIRVTLLRVAGFLPTATTILIVRWNGSTVLKWVDKVEIVYKPGTVWQDHLHNVASGVVIK